jgi:intracellular septation protein
MWRLTGRISPMQVMTMIIMTLSGVLTVRFNDECFFKMCTTVVYLTLSAVLWVDLARGQAWLSGLMGGMVALSSKG